MARSLKWLYFGIRATLTLISIWIKCGVSWIQIFKILIRHFCFHGCRVKYVKFTLFYFLFTHTDLNSELTENHLYTVYLCSECRLCHQNKTIRVRLSPSSEVIVSNAIPTCINSIWAINRLINKKVHFVHSFIIIVANQTIHKNLIFYSKLAKYR